MDLSELVTSIDTLQRGLKHAQSELEVHRSAPLTDVDALTSTLSPFVRIAEPQIDMLLRMRAELQTDATSLLGFFGEGKDGKIEDLFGIIAGFSAGLQKAAAEMSRHLLQASSSAKQVKGRPNPGERVNGQARLLAAAAAKITGDEADAEEKDKPAGHKIQGSDTSQASTLKALPTPSLLLPPGEKGQAGTSRFGRMGTMARAKGTVRGTLSKGELDEAIRSIHGGVTRRERTMREGTMSRGGGVRLSKMFLDGKGSVKVPDISRGSGFVGS